MHDVIYFDDWSDIICTAAKLLQETSAAWFPPQLGMNGNEDSPSLHRHGSQSQHH